VQHLNRETPGSYIDIAVRSLWDSVSQTFLHVDPQIKYTLCCRPRGLAQQLLIQGIIRRPTA